MGTEVKALFDSWAETFEYLPNVPVDDTIEAIRPRVLSILERFIKMAAETFGGFLFEDMGLKTAEEVFGMSMEDWVKNYSLDRSVYITDRMKQRVRDQINTALNNGENLGNITLRVRNFIKNSKAAYRIARTEVHTAAEMGSFLAAKALGIGIAKEWASLEDLRVRFDHAVADGQTRPLDEPFIVGGERLMVPGDPAGSAKQVVNCRCTALYHPVVNGEIRR